MKIFKTVVNMALTAMIMITIFFSCSGPAANDSDKHLSYYVKAHEYFQNNQPEKAIPLYKKTIKAKVDFSPAYHEIAVCYQQVGDDAKAIEHFQGAIVYNARDVDAYQSIGNIYFMQINYDEALRWYERGAEVDYLYPRTYNNMATIYYMRGNYNDAKLNYSRAIAVDPTYPRAHYGLGLIAYIGGDTTEAETKFLDAVKTGSMPEAIYMLGTLYYNKGDLTQAEAWLTRYLEKEPYGEWAEKSKDTLILIEQRKNKIR